MGTITVATQLYGWSQERVFPGKPPILERLNETFASIKRAGFDHVEWNLNMFEDMAEADRFYAALDANGLGMESIYYGFNCHEEDAALAAIDAGRSWAKVAAERGIRVVNSNPAAKEGQAEKTDEELGIQARMLERTGEMLGEFNIKLGYHNHSPEMRSEAREVHHALRQTDPKLVGFCADTEWINHGGGDVMAFLGEYAARTVSVHLRNAVGTVWTESLDQGDIDHLPIAEILKKNSFDGVIALELCHMDGMEITRDFEENNRISREHIREVFGV